MKQPATLMWNAPTNLEVPTLIVEEWHCTLKTTKSESTVSAQGHAPLNKGGLYVNPQNPQTITPDSLEM